MDITRNTFATALICILISGLVSGCFGQSAETRYYALDSAPAEPNDKDISLGVGPFELPDYLNRSQIVVRDENNQLILHEFDRWAENLEVGMSRRIAAEVSRLNKDVLVYEFIRTSSFPGDYRVFGQVIKFEADQNNTVILEVVWGLAKLEQNRINPQNKGERSRYSRQIKSSTDLNEVTQAMAELLDDFSADIATRMQQSLDAEQADSA
ncbi:MAG: PqiC family protein [Gammaproteobacteria bacterium]